MKFTQVIENNKDQRGIWNILWNILRIRRSFREKTLVFMSKRYSNVFYYYANRILYEWNITIHSRIKNKRKLIIRQFRQVFGVVPDLNNPKTLNEKLQWLKLYDHKDLYTMCADKYGVREYIREKFGDDFLIPLVYHTNDWRTINAKTINHFPCIVKANHSSKDFVIIKNEKDIDWNKLQLECRWWLHRDYYAESLEWQYKNIKRQIVVEELLQTSNGHIPNDYKLHYFNGVLQFVYVSVDREGCNARNIYDPDWKPLFFQWNGRDRNAENRRGDEIAPPKSFEQMKQFGSIIAKDFKYVRVDYYDVEGRLYFGEITLQHGGGFDVFVPDSYDLYFGDMLNIQD